MHKNLILLCKILIISSHLSLSLSLGERETEGIEMAASSLLLNGFSVLTPKPSKPMKFFFNCPKKPGRITAKSSTEETDFDLYDLLGIDNSSNQAEIKTAYRSLQKRCHPDIAGPDGHDMAIILNQAYSILSDPISRSIYDREHAKISEFQGYTGRPLYSTWFGSENEGRAVFVDEVKCVGCLKCALLAEKTFAIESVYGRARVVAQWADPEHKIYDAIQSCPVDCISMVERSNLAALEFLMSKQPRGNVGMSIDSTGGARVANIFVDIYKFQARFRQMKEKAFKPESKDSEARISAIEAIRRISGWWYWQSPTTPKPNMHSHHNVKYIADKSVQTDTNKLREAAAKRRERENTRPIYRNPASSGDDEYWTPTLILPAITNDPVSKTSQSTILDLGKTPSVEEVEEEIKVVAGRKSFPAISMIPTGVSTIAAIVVGFEGGERMSSTGLKLKEHIGGSIALQIVNSSWLQILLAGFTWYLIGFVVVELAGKSCYEKFRQEHFKK